MVLGSFALALPNPPGLEDQLLGKLILKEKHELEEQRQALLEEVQSYKKKIKQLEDDLLFRWGVTAHGTEGLWDGSMECPPSRAVVDSTAVAAQLAAALLFDRHILVVKSSDHALKACMGSESSI